MPSPFPGMDPYLEHPALWPDVHHELAAQLRRQLQERVGPRYYVALGERVYLEAPVAGQLVPDAVVIERPGERAPAASAGSPTSAAGAAGAAVADAPAIVLLDEFEVREPFLEVRDLHREHRVVTVIEVLSPANKRPGAGREEYLRKQHEVLGSAAHLLELDLLRGGAPTVAVPASRATRTAYRVVVARADRRSQREVYERALQDPLPRVAVPLAAPDPDVVLDLPAALALAYEAGAYARRIDYATPPVPPLAPDDAAWARARVAAWGR